MVVCVLLMGLLTITVLKNKIHSHKLFSLTKIMIPVII